MAAQKVDHEKLQKAAKDLGLSSYQIGAAARLPQATVARILRGAGESASTTLKAVCDVLDLDINDVFTTDEIKAAA